MVRCVVAVFVALVAGQTVAAMASGPGDSAQPRFALTQAPGPFALLGFPPAEGSLLLFLRNRELAAAARVFTVDSTGNDSDKTVGDGICKDDDEHCSLRAAIEEANSSPGRDEIAFGITGGSTTIRVLTQLPPITDPVVINGSTQPGFHGMPMIVLDGNVEGIRPHPWGLLITAGNSEIRGLVITNFGPDNPAPQGGIVLSGNGGNSIVGNFIGTNVAGTAALPNWHGVVVGSSNNVIGGTLAGEGNVISGNDAVGVLVNGAANNVIEGNRIGVGADGRPLPNVTGVLLTSGATRNVVGGRRSSSQCTGPCNVVSGNATSAVSITGAGTDLNAVVGNYIGLDPAGAASVPAGGTGPGIGIVVRTGASHNTLGGERAGRDCVGWCNVVSGNKGNGIQIRQAGSDGNIVLGNYVGLNATGSAAVPNGYGTPGNAPPAVVVSEGAAHNLIGGDARSGGCDASCNVISGNDGNGIAVRDVGTVDNVVRGNYVGVDPTGMTARPNGAQGGFPGIVVLSGATNTRIGSKRSPTTCDAGCNLVSGNIGPGVRLRGQGTKNNLVEGNSIGTNAPGTGALGNGTSGVEIVEGASDNTVGGTTPASANLISGNQASGVRITGSTKNSVVGNLIGTNPSGTGALGNGASGVEITDGASSNTIGGASPSSANLISGNKANGVTIRGSIGNSVVGNLIGTDIAKKPVLGNQGDGVSVFNGANDTVVGWGLSSNPALAGCSDSCNRIAGNGGNGVVVAGLLTHGVAIRANEIFGNGPSGPASSPGLGIDLDESAHRGVTPNDTGDGDAGPNDLLNFPVGVTAAVDPRTGSRTVSGLVDGPNPDKIVVDLYSLDKVDPYPAFGEGAEWLAAVKPDTSGRFLHVIPPGVAPGAKFFSATATNGSGSTSEFSAVCGDPDGDGSTDTDGDALCDDWERFGLDFNGDMVVDLPLQSPPYGADAARKDLFVEVDFMQALPRSERPQPDGLRMVQRAFDKAPVCIGGKCGINLHLSPNPKRVDLSDEAVPAIPAPTFHGEVGPLPFSAPDDLWDLKFGDPALPCDGFFGTADDRLNIDGNCANRLGAKKLVFRYSLFGQSFKEEPDASGYVALDHSPGNDFLVAIAHLGSATIETWGGKGGIPPQCASASTCRANAEAGTFMHELGHSLGLDHGGLDKLNYKPNYLSVMSYTFQAQDVVPTRPLDYSHWKLDSLNEVALDEKKGICLPAQSCAADLGGGRSTAFTRPAGAKCDWKVVSAVGPIDWNDKSGIEAGTVQAGIDEPEGGCKTSEDRELASDDDWANLQYGFRNTPKGFTVGKTASAVRADAAAADFDGDGVSNLQDNCNVIVNPGQSDSDGDGIGDVCAARITDVNLAVFVEAAPRRATIGAAVVFTVKVTNDWPVAAPGTTVSVLIPSGFRVTSMNASQGSYTPATGIWRVGEVPKRRGATLTIATRAMVEGRFNAIAEVTASARPDRNSTPGNGDPVEDDRAVASVATVAPPETGAIETFAGAWTGPTPATRTGQAPLATAVRGRILYIADAAANQIKAVDLESRLETVVAGNGTRGEGGDGGPARAAQFALPQGLTDAGGLVVDPAGNLYVADTDNNRVRRVSPNGVITTVAGSGRPGASGDGGLATAARLDRPRGLALDGTGNLYIADSGNKRIRKVDRAGKISTAATLAAEPRTVAVRANGNLLVAPGPFGPFASETVVEIDPTGATSVFASNSTFSRLVQVVVGPQGSVYITDNEDMRVHVIDASGLRPWAGSGWVFGEPNGVFRGDGGLASFAFLSRPTGVSFDAAGNGYIADRGNHRVRKVDASGLISTVAGGTLLSRTASCCVSGEYGPAAAAQLGRPGSLAVAPNGNLVLVDEDNFSVHIVDPGGSVTRLAGLNRLNCFCEVPDSTNAWDVRLDHPSGIAVGTAGDAYLGESAAGGYGFVHKIQYHPERGDQFPFRTTIAGNGFANEIPDGGKATDGNIAQPLGLRVDKTGNLYIAETGKNRVRKVTPNGLIFTVAGTGIAGQSGDGGQAKQAQLQAPEDVEVAADGTLYIADTGNNKVRKVKPNGLITTVAGTGARGFGGDGSPATRAVLNEPSDLALDGDGTLYVADRRNHRLRMVTPSGVILTIAGTGSSGVAGDGVLPTAAPLQLPNGLALDRDRNLLVSTGPRVRRLRAPTGRALYVSDLWVKEGTGQSKSANVTVTLLHAATSTVTVRYQTVDGTAAASSDYASTSGVLAFAPGVVSKTIPIKIVGDALREAGERFALALSAPTGGAAIADLAAEVTIANDD